MHDHHTVTPGPTFAGCFPLCKNITIVCYGQATGTDCTPGVRRPAAFKSAGRNPRCNQDRTTHTPAARRLRTRGLRTLPRFSPADIKLSPTLSGSFARRSRARARAHDQRPVYPTVRAPRHADARRLDQLRVCHGGSA